MTPPQSSTKLASSAARLVKSVRDQVSPEEWAVRVDLAAAYRLVDMFGWTELTANHISCRVPGTEDQFLINAHGLLYDEVCASNLIKIDIDGNTIFNPTEYKVLQAGFVIHSAIHKARPDLECVAHTHTLAGMAISALECGVLPIVQNSMRFARIAYHEFEGVAINLEERERLAADLGDLNAMVLRNHGLLACGTSVADCFTMLFRLERACQTQLLAMACNSPLHMVAQSVIEKSFERERHNKHWPAAAWPALLRKLDRTDPSYKN